MASYRLRWQGVIPPCRVKIMIPSCATTRKNVTVGQDAWVGIQASGWHDDAMRICERNRRTAIRAEAADMTCAGELKCSD
jgi:hypothetical protein